MELKQPCIAIDVSKGSSHVCGFIETRKPLDQVFEINHDSCGFEKLVTVFTNLFQRTNQEPIFVFESTGIYHRPLKNFLENKMYRFIEVSPLLAAKHSKNSSIRSAKTDARDTHALAKLFYDVDFDIKESKDEIYHELKQYHRYYFNIEPIMIKYKVHFNEKLDILFPRFRKDISQKVYNQYYLELFKECHHPQIIVEKRVDWLENFFIKNGMQNSRTRSMAKHVKEYCKNCWPGSSSSSVVILIFKQIIEQLQYYELERKSIIERMVTLGKKYPLYSQLLSVPGIGPNLAIRLIAEVGDLSLFENSSQLIAYAGIDPTVYQSGNLDGKGLSISKKGNKYLRKILFLVIDGSVHSHFDHRIKDFYQRKKQTSSTKFAYVASCDKLFKIIFKMYQTGELYNL